MSSTRATLPMSTTTAIRTTTTRPTRMGFARILEAHISPVLGSVSPKGKIIPVERLNDSAKAEPLVCRFALCGNLRKVNTRGLTL